MLDRGADKDPPHVPSPRRRSPRTARQRRDRAVLPASHHSRSRHGGPGTPQGCQGAAGRHRGAGLTPGPVPGGRRRRHDRTGRRRRRRRLQSPTAGDPRDLRHRQGQTRLCRGVHPRRESPCHRGQAPHLPRLVECPGHRGGLRPGHRRHRQLPHALPGQRRLRPVGHTQRVRLDLPLRGATERVLGRPGSLLPLHVPGATAARTGAQLCRGWRARDHGRPHRHRPGHRGDQAAHGDR